MRRLLLVPVLLLGLSAPALAQSAGSSDISVRGIEDVVTALQARKGDRNAAQAALFLTLLKQIGRPAAHEGGRSRLEYQVQVAADGGILVNGIDIIPIINTAAKLSPKK